MTQYKTSTIQEQIKYEYNEDINDDNNRKFDTAINNNIHIDKTHYYLININNGAHQTCFRINTEFNILY